MAFIWEAVRDEGDRLWGQTELNSYLTYKLWDFREGTSFISLVLQLKFHFPCQKAYLHLGLVIRIKGGHVAKCP